MSESSPWLESGLNIDALRYFLAAIELGSFQAAAERLHVTPQAVGKAIAALEARLGPLLIRDRRLRGLTPTGRALAAEARGLVAALSDLPSCVAPIGSPTPAGPVAVAGPSSVAQYVLPPVVAALRAKHPRVKPQVFALDTGRVERSLLDGELDLGVLASAPTREGLEAAPGPEARAVIVAAGGTPPGDWSDFEYVVPRALDASGRAIDGWPPRGFPRRLAAETNQLEVAIRLAEAGVGASVVPLVAVRDRLAAGTLVVVARPPVAIAARLWVTWRAGDRRSAAAIALAEALAAWQAPDAGFDTTM
jgi:DNA-binding transcriptional LysR family regulator